MLTTTRRFAKSWVAAVIIGLLIVGLAIVGVTDVFRFDFSTHVIKAGDREVSQQQFAQIVDNLNEQNAQQTGQRKRHIAQHLVAKAPERTVHRGLQIVLEQPGRERLRHDHRHDSSPATLARRRAMIVAA